ncbi:MAG TPA: iron-containing alcohol dehydrogenase [Myxococcaceae bacterium]|jgi:alcohol dehydrogenase class IV|nr:iron-containing alcohol dehydrogenase [Myxococcaceae bacterium]
MTDTSLFDLPVSPRIAVLSWPTRIVLGPGALKRLPDEVRRLGLQRPLVVTDTGVVKAGLVDRVLAVLGEAGIVHVLFDRVTPDPTEPDVFAGLEAYRTGGCDGIIALGGGSPLDAAKLVQLLTSHSPPLSQYDDATGGDRFVTHSLPPLIAIPTTAGTGSEVSRSGVAFLKDTGRKTVIFAPALLPRAAIVDPELTYGLPPRATAATGLDAFTHCLEAYLSSGFHPLADAVAIDGIRRVSRSLPVVLREPTHTQARLDMMIAAMEGAMAFQKGLGNAHALAHALTPVAGLHHGLANAVVLPSVMTFNRGVSRSRLARVAVAMGEPSGTVEDVLAGLAIDRVRRLVADAGLPTRLSDAGVKELDLPRIAELAFRDASHQGNPRPTTEADLLEIARAAF